MDLSDSVDGLTLWIDIGFSFWAAFIARPFFFSRGEHESSQIGVVAASRVDRLLPVSENAGQDHEVDRRYAPRQRTTQDRFRASRPTVRHCGRGRTCRRFLARSSSPMLLISQRIQRA